MLGVDRLDMIKGIPQKILAFENFLEENPSWQHKVVLLQIAVPTRTDVPECKLLFSFPSSKKKQNIEPRTHVYLYSYIEANYHTSLCVSIHQKSITAVSILEMYTFIFINIL